MATVIANIDLYFARPWWLLALTLLVPVVMMARQNLQVMHPVRRYTVLILRCLGIVLLILMLARLMFVKEAKELTVLTVLDRSQSIPEALSHASLDYVTAALETKPTEDQFALVDVAETACISELPSISKELRRRNTTLEGQQTNLAEGVQMAMAIAPPNTGTRILLITEGNQTAGDLEETARIAAANKIPIDVLPLRYHYQQEVLLKRLAVPIQARSRQTVSLRFILESMRETRGSLFLTLNDEPVDLDPETARTGVTVQLQPGTNVHTLSVPLGTRGVHEFEAVFVPDDPNADQVTQNNRASAMTFVSGPGHSLVVDTDGTVGPKLVSLLASSDIEAQAILATEFPTSLNRLMEVDAILLANVDCSALTLAQQEMIHRYVTEMGGGLIMVGGPNSFGAGGWIGSPVAEVLPVDLDPPQKKQMPKGALALIMHACEMPQGNYWGIKTAAAAVNTLSSQDLAGILAYGWQGRGDWVFPLKEVGDKQALIAAIQGMRMGDMPSLATHLQLAYDALMAADAAQKHVIVISDGDPAPPGRPLLDKMKAAGITCTGVAVFPHNIGHIESLVRVAQLTGGRFYDVKSPLSLPQIFIKEAQEVKRSLIVEQTFVPQINYSLSEILKGLPSRLPNLDGYVMTAPKGGLSQMVLSSAEGDPILATCQAGLGRCVAFTSSMDTRWGASWLAWPVMERFVEQIVRWVGKPAQASDCEVMVDVQGRRVDVHVESVDSEGQFQQLSRLKSQVIRPDLDSEMLDLTQVGPGQYHAQFEAGQGGSYIINLQYHLTGEDSTSKMMQSAVTIPFAPEFGDLSDNAPLLASVSDMTGGRILMEDPNLANVFDHAGVTFPRTQFPLLPYLLKIWLVVFLLDVAVRRVVLDVQGMRRKVVQWLRSSKAKSKEEQAVSRLKMTQKRIRAQLKSRSRAAKTGETATKRYVGSTDATEALPTVQVNAPVAAKPKPKEGKKPKVKPAPAPESSTIQQLLKAKRKAKGDDDQ